MKMKFLVLFVYVSVGVNSVLMTNGEASEVGSAWDILRRALYTRLLKTRGPLMVVYEKSHIYIPAEPSESEIEESNDHLCIDQHVLDEATSASKGYDRKLGKVAYDSVEYTDSAEFGSGSEDIVSTEVSENQNSTRTNSVEIFPEKVEEHDKYSTYSNTDKSVYESITTALPGHYTSIAASTDKIDTTESRYDTATSTNEPNTTAFTSTAEGDGFTDSISPNSVSRGDQLRLATPSEVTEYSVAHGITSAVEEDYLDQGPTVSSTVVEDYIGQGPTLSSTVVVMDDKYTTSSPPSGRREEDTPEMIERFAEESTTIPTTTTENENNTSSIAESNRIYKEICIEIGKNLNKEDNDHNTTSPKLTPQGADETSFPNGGSTESGSVIKMNEDEYMRFNTENLESSTEANDNYTVSSSKEAKELSTDKIVSVDFAPPAAEQHPISSYLMDAPMNAEAGTPSPEDDNIYYLSTDRAVSGGGSIDSAKDALTSSRNNTYTMSSLAEIKQPEEEYDEYTSTSSSSARRKVFDEVQ